MKNLRKTLEIVLLGSGIASIPTISSLAQEKSGQVTITDTRIEIHPGTKISENDEKALNAVLKKYGESLYKIETLKDGKLKVQGRLEDKHIETTLAAEVKKAKAAGMSDHTERVVDHQHSQALPPPAGKGKVVGRELIDSLKPILEKYTKK